MILRVAALLVAISAWLATGVDLAQAQTRIFPISNPGGPPPFVPNTSSSVFITLSTDPWLPEPSTNVTITVNGAANPVALTLVCPDGSEMPTSCSPVSAPFNPIQPGPGLAAQLRTSAYPGVCTNVPDPAAPLYQADFRLNGSVLTSNDCGGMAVVRATAADGTVYTFVLPQDSDFDGIPDRWEVKFGPASGAGSVVANADNDNDGISNFDEYRGVVLNGTHIRLHHNERDVFVALIKPGCGGSPSLLSGTNAYVPDLTNAQSLFTNLQNAIPATATNVVPGPRVHPVGFPAGAPVDHSSTNEWTDSFAGCAFNSVTGDLDLTFLANPPADLDRLVTANAVYSLSERPNTTLTVSGNVLTAGAKVFNESHIGAVVTVISGGTGRATITALTNQRTVVATIDPAAPFSPATVAAGAWRIGNADQKGLRCIESLDTSSQSIFALSGWTTPDDTLSCTIYSKRIEFRMRNTDTTLGALGLIPKGLTTRKLRIQTTPDGGKTWTTVFTEGDGGTTRAEAERRVVAEVMRFYLTMEYMHGLKQKPTLGTCTNHDCAGTGYVLDKDFVQVIDRSTTGFNTFRIPTVSNSTITSGAKLRDP